MDKLSLITKPIADKLSEFGTLFKESLSTPATDYPSGILQDALLRILSHSGKQMRPILVLLTAKNYGEVNSSTLNGAVGLELLHTASLVHDDVVDESLERRGQPSTNAIYNNKVSVLVGDYILSTALYYVAGTGNRRMVSYLAELGRILSQGEIDQLTNISRTAISEADYFQVIRQKTAALFAACAKIGALSVNASEEEIRRAEIFGETLGLIFQIKDDIFDYYESLEIGKPTGNDMAEGKLTLPVIHALTSTGDEAMFRLAAKIKARTIDHDEIQQLVAFTKQNGGIDYAKEKMEELRKQCQAYISSCPDGEIRIALTEYLDFIIQRTS